MSESEEKEIKNINFKDVVGRLAPTMVVEYADGTVKEFEGHCIEDEKDGSTKDN